MQHLPSKAQFFEHTGAEILDQYIGVLQKLNQNFFAALLLQIEGNAFFVTSFDSEPQILDPAHVAHQIAFLGRLHLDYLGAEIS